MSDSIWKKEISFKKKPKEAAAAAPAEPKPAGESIWKKEISLSRKPKEPKAPRAPKEPKAGGESFLKKEISFSRKPKEPKAPRAPKEPKAGGESFLKKEISFSRKKRDKEIERLAEQAAQAVSPTFTPVEPAPVVPPPTAVAEAVVAAMPEPEPVQPVEEPVVAEVQFVEHAPQPEPLSTLSPAILAASAEAPQLAPDPVVEDAVPEPVAVEPAWQEPEPAAEPWLAEAELPPAPEPAVVVHPPVPAAELPPLPEEPAAKVPFWKKEISLGGKAKQPKQPKPAKEKASSTPFWKKELPLGKKKPAAAESPTELLPAAPFWKRELALPKVALPSRGGGGGRKGGHGAKRLVGLKIGASQLAAARVSNNGSAHLEQVAREPLLPGVVVGGELRDPDALAEALKAFFARHKLPRKGVRLGIASNRIGVRLFEIVGVEEEKQLANAVHFRAQEALPIPLDEAVLDYRVLDESVNAEGENVKRVLLVVAYRELVERYIGACRKAGIGLVGVDLEAFALLRALTPPADRGNSALVAVSIGHDRSTFAVSDGRVCEFTRVLEWGGSSLNVALARAFDTTPSEVEAIKRALSLETNAVPPGLTEEQTAVALDAVRRQVQSFARELVSSLQFYQGQPGSLGIGELVLTGGTAHLPGLAAELQRLIGVQVRVGDPLARLKVAKRVAEADQVGSLAVAIGLGIED